MLEQALHRMGVDAGESVIIGDRLDTDIVANHRAGMLTVHVVTGVSARDDVSLVPLLPDLILTDLTALVDALVSEP